MTVWPWFIMASPEITGAGAALTVTGSEGKLVHPPEIEAIAVIASPAETAGETTAFQIPVALAVAVPIGIALS